MQTLAALRRTGAVERIPSWIQNRLAKISEKASRIHSAVIAVNEIVVREMSYRIMQARSEDTDQTWSNNAAATYFQLLLNTRPAVLSEMSDIKAILAERIRDPKHLGDLISR
jgi:hypothetical protein